MGEMGYFVFFVILDVYFFMTMFMSGNFRIFA